VTALPEPVGQRVQRVISRFDEYLRDYDERFPFTRSGQLDHHASTIECLRSHGNDPIAALGDEAFVDSLYATLRAWGIGVRGSRLRPKDVLVASLLSEGDALAALSQRAIWEPRLLDDSVDELVWLLIEEVDLVENEAKLVALTKTLHHLLPDLVVPIDRRYTGAFFGWSPARMQHGQRDLFMSAFRIFNQIAQAVDLPSRSGSAWRSAPSKLIDNAIIAYCLQEVGAPEVKKGMLRKPRDGKYDPLRKFLLARGGTVELSFGDIDDLVGGLPPSARNDRPWWANTAGRPQAKAWLGAEKKVDMVDFLSEMVRFRSKD
jgi:hypothetical protein